MIYSTLTERHHVFVLSFPLITLSAGYIKIKAKHKPGNSIGLLPSLVVIELFKAAIDFYFSSLNYESVKMKVKD